MEKKQIYHFLDIQFGFYFASFLFEQGLKEKADITLVFSQKNWVRKRRIWSPLKIYDRFQLLKEKNRIINKVKPFGYSVLFIKDVNAADFTRTIPKGSIGICTGFNQIFKKKLIESLIDFVNIHPSLLPYYRGPTPIEWCIKNEERYTGWTLHRINEKIDDGEILYQEIVDVKTSVDEVKFDIIKVAKRILFEYLESKILKKDFIEKKVDATFFYSKKIDYLSFY